MDHELEDILGSPDLTKEQFLSRCPGVFPLTDNQLTWWESWWENHPDEQANSEISYYEYCKKQSAEWFCHKLFLREFLEKHSISGIGEFYLHIEDKKVTIRPICPIGESKTFEFKL